MNKAEFTEELIARNGKDIVCNAQGVPSKAAAERLVNSMLCIIKDELKEHRDVCFSGFGTFTTVNRKETVGRNPQTGAELVIPATVAPKFKAGQPLKDAVACK